PAASSAAGSTAPTPFPPRRISPRADADRRRSPLADRVSGNRRRPSALGQHRRAAPRLLLSDGRMSMTGRDDPAGPGRDRRGEQRLPHRAADGAPDDGLYSEDVLDSDDRQPIDSDAVGQPWEVAERSRPDLSDETADGLSPLEEETRRVTEDVPVGPV